MVYLNCKIIFNLPICLKGNQENWKNSEYLSIMGILLKHTYKSKVFFPLYRIYRLFLSAHVIILTLSLQMGLQCFELLQPTHPCLYVVILIYIIQKLHFLYIVAFPVLGQEISSVPGLYPCSVQLEMTRVTRLHGQQFMYLHCRSQFSERSQTRLWEKKASTREACWELSTVILSKHASIWLKHSIKYRSKTDSIIEQTHSELPF